MKNNILTLYNEVIYNNKCKEVILNGNIIEHGRKKIYILDLDYINGVFETNINKSGYSLISSDHDIKKFCKTFINSEKLNRYSTLYINYQDNLYYICYSKENNGFILYSLSVEGYGNYYYL